MSALALPAVGSTRRETSVALAADLAVAVGLGGQNLERRLDDTTTETGADTRHCQHVDQEMK